MMGRKHQERKGSGLDRELQEDSNGVIESIWDGHGVEFKTEYVFCFFCFGRDPKM